MRPRKRSPQTWLAPKLSGPSPTDSSPSTGSEPAAAPFTNRRSVAPSNVAARCVQRFPSRTDGPLTPVWPPRNTAGRSASLLAYSPYAAPALLSLKMTLRQAVAAVGFTQASRVIPVVRRSAGVVGHGDDVVDAVEREGAAETSRAAPGRAGDVAVVTAALVHRHGPDGLLEAVRGDRVRGAGADHLRCPDVRARTADAVDGGDIRLDGVARITVARLGQVKCAAVCPSDRRPVAEPLIAVAQGVAVGVREPARRDGEEVLTRRARRLQLRGPGGGDSVRDGGRADGRIAGRGVGVRGGDLDLERIAAVAGTGGGEVERGRRGARDGVSVAEPLVAVGERVSVGIAEAGR